MTRDELKRIEQEQFVEDCVKEYDDGRPLHEVYKKTVAQLMAWSYFPQAISVATMIFFIVWLLDSYETQVKILLGLILICVAFALEYGKRIVITKFSYNYFMEKKIAAGLLLLVLLFAAMSETGSFFGGQKLVTETDTGVELTGNPEIDSLNALINAEKINIEKFQATTWQGKIVRNAQAGILNSQGLINGWQDRINLLTTKQDGTHQELTEEHEAKIIGFGYILGGVAAFCDVLLFAMLWTVKKLRYKIYLLIRNKGKKKRNKNGASYQSNGATKQRNNETEQRSSIWNYFRNGKTGGSNVTNEASCVTCNESFVQLRNNHRFCSDACRVTYHRQKAVM